MCRFPARSVLVVQRQRCRDIRLLPLLGRSLYAFLLRYARSAHPAVLPVDRRCRKPLARTSYRRAPARVSQSPTTDRCDIRESSRYVLASWSGADQSKRPTGHNRSPPTRSRFMRAPESGAEAIDRSLGVTGAPDTTLDECASWRRGIRGAPWADTRSGAHVSMAPNRSLPARELEPVDAHSKESSVGVSENRPVTQHCGRIVHSSDRSGRHTSSAIPRLHDGGPPEWRILVRVPSDCWCDRSARAGITVSLFTPMATSISTSRCNCCPMGRPFLCSRFHKDLDLRRRAFGKTVWQFSKGWKTSLS